MDIANVLEANFWSVICESHDNVEDSDINWVVVGYFMAPPYERVIGASDEFGGVEGAIKDALETIKDDNYAYQSEYKP